MSVSAQALKATRADAPAGGWQAGPGGVPSGSDVVDTARALLSLPDDQLDYARAKLAFDRLVDPAVDEGAVLSKLERMEDDAWRLAGPFANAALKVAAIRTIIYKSGIWNAHRPFAYDHENFRDIRVKLISHYLATRRGNCVSMPILFLILAERLGLDIGLAMAGTHYFVRYRDDGGADINLETTGEALPARDVWLRQVSSVSDAAVQSGFCMRTLSRRENIAAMATTVLEHLRAEGRNREAIAISEISLGCNPVDGITWANQGQAFFGLLKDEFGRYQSQLLIPLPLRPRYLLLLQRNHAAFATARKLGWKTVQQPQTWSN